MIIEELNIKGVFEIKLEPKNDDRGFFMRTYDNKIFAEHGIHKTWVQENQSFSAKKGTVRGLHFQYPPHVETRLVRVLQGKAFFAFVDLRKGSETFGGWGSAVLSEEEKNMLFVPRGLMLGMCTLADNTTLYYKMDNYHTPESAETIKWNDPDLGINWPVEEPAAISERDLKGKSFKEFKRLHGGLE